MHRNFPFNDFNKGIGPLHDPVRWQGTHAGNGGTKVVDQLLIDISTGDSSVVGSQSSARDNIQTIDSGKSVPRERLTSENTAKTTTNRSASSMAKSQSEDVLKGLNELKDLQRQSLSSMNQLISAMTSAVETFTQVKTSRKRKRAITLFQSELLLSAPQYPVCLF